MTPGVRCFKPIAAGARVAVVAPAGPVPIERYRAGLSLLADRYRIIRAHDPDATQPAALPYLAADDAGRAAALEAALTDPEVQAIFCARGGYGCSRLLDRLDRRLLQRRSLPIVGFSDVTALHAWANGLGVASVHGPVVTQLPLLPADDIEALYRLLETPDSATLGGLRCVVPGAASGPLVGGNLTVLAHLCGTRYLPRLDGSIVLLEDVDEAPYRLDRALTQLRQAGLFSRANGVVLGAFVNCGTLAVDAIDAGAVLAERLADLGLPVAAGAPIGHAQRNVALPIGLSVRLDATAGTLRVTPLQNSRD